MIIFGIILLLAAAACSSSLDGVSFSDPNSSFKEMRPTHTFDMEEVDWKTKRQVEPASGSSSGALTSYMFQSLEQICQECDRDEPCFPSSTITYPPVHNSYSCQCDIYCSIFGDCCGEFDPYQNLTCASELDAEDEQPYSDVEDPSLFECQSLYRDQSFNMPAESRGQYGIYMISYCPSSWIVEGEYGSTEERTEVQSGCTGESTLPPVSDSTTGRVYKNELCAICHSANEIDFWRYRMSCSRELLTDLPTSPLTIGAIDEYCYACPLYFPAFYFEPPTSLREEPRTCSPYVSTCLSYEDFSEFIEFEIIPEDDYNQLIQHCLNSSVNLVQGHSFLHSAELVFKNSFCAICNALVENGDHGCFTPLASLPQCTTVSEIDILIDSYRETVFILDPDNDLGMLSPDVQLETVCRIDQLYDFTNQTCINIFCNTSADNYQCSMSSRISLAVDRGEGETLDELLDSTEPIECTFCSLDGPCTLTEFLPNNASCQCDQICEFFEDCCFHFDHGELTCFEQLPDDVFEDLEVDFQCQTLYKDSNSSDVPSQQLGAYMISECPDQWQIFGELGTSEERILIEANCTGDSTLLPASDADTGRVYKNEYCAICNSVTSISLWRHRLKCSRELLPLLQSGAEVNFEIIHEHCDSSHLVIPPLMIADTSNTSLYVEGPRSCTPAISSCISYGEFLDLDLFQTLPFEEYDRLQQFCLNNATNLVQGFSQLHGGVTIFKNDFCAICNGLLPSNFSCFAFEPPSQNISYPLNSTLSPIVLILDTVLGIVDIFDPTLSQTEEFSFIPPVVLMNVSIVVNCPAGKIYDFNSRECRDTLCQSVNCTIVGFSSATMEELPTNGMPTCMQLLILDDPTLYFPIDGTRFYFLPLLSLVFAVSLTEDGLPVVCLDQAVPFVLPFLATLMRINTAFNASAFVISIISIILCLLVILVYTVLKPMRSVFGFVLVNLAVSFLLSDFVLLLGGPVSNLTKNQSLCTTAAVFEQLFSISQFIWLSILGFDVAFRYHRIANSLPKRSKLRVMIIYLATGWSIPLVLTVAVIITNFVISDVVYGPVGNCHITQRQSGFALFVFPDIISIISGVIALIVCLVLICRSPFKFQKRDTCRFVLLFVFFVIMTFVSVILLLITGSGSANMRGLIGNFLSLLLIIIRTIFFASVFVFTKKTFKSIFSLFGAKRTNKVSPISSVGLEQAVGEIRTEPIGSAEVGGGDPAVVGLIRATENPRVNLADNEYKKLITNLENPTNAFTN